VKLRSFIDRSWEAEKGGMADEGRWTNEKIRR
jgi:hypothetical protein